MSSTVTHKGESQISPLLLKVLGLNTKIKQRHYTFKNNKCFCGHSEGQNVTNKDRYGIFYSLKLCSNCGVMYADNIMTQKSMEQFYENDYRDIYDYNLNLDLEFKNGKRSGEYIHKLLSDYDSNFDVVFDIGCNEGSKLSAFKDSEIYGVDYSKDRISFGKDKGLNLYHGGIDILEGLGKKADVIILSHVLEHFIDLEKELDRISKLLKEDGFLYVEVPGLYWYDVESIYQNAHNWQFTTNTLTYIMECCGFQPWHCDSIITSLWKYTGIKRDKKSIYPNESKEIIEYAYSDNKKCPTISNHCKFSLKQRKKNVKESISLKLPDLRKLKDAHSGKEGIIVSGGSTINNYLETIRDMQNQGKIIFCIERMMQWLVDNDIMPDYVICMDLADDVCESFESTHEDINYIINSNCNKDIFNLLEDNKVHIFSTQQLGVNHADEWASNGYDKTVMINTGGSISLACYSVGIYLGIRKFNIFGFDCHVTDNFYASGITGRGTPDEEVINIEVNGNEYNTTATYLSFARQFFGLYDMANKQGIETDIKIYGDSLVKAISKIDIDGDKKGS